MAESQIWRVVFAVGHSLATFLNAMTYPDKTVYEIAAELAQQAQLKPKSKSAQQLNELITSYSFLSKAA